MNTVFNCFVFKCFSYSMHVIKWNTTVCPWTLFLISLYSSVSVTWCIQLNEIQLCVHEHGFNFFVFRCFSYSMHAIKWNTAVCHWTLFLFSLYSSVSVSQWMQLNEIQLGVHQWTVWQLSALDIPELRTEPWHWWLVLVILYRWFWVWAQPLRDGVTM